MARSPASSMVRRKPRPRSGRATADSRSRSPQARSTRSKRLRPEAVGAAPFSSTPHRLRFPRQLPSMGPAWRSSARLARPANPRTSESSSMAGKPSIEPASGRIRECLMVMQTSSSLRGAGRPRERTRSRSNPELLTPRSISARTLPVQSEIQARLRTRAPTKAAILMFGVTRTRVSS